MASPRKYALITGCRSGNIGSALAEGFLEKGYHVFATVRDPSNASPTLSAAPNVTILTLDVLSSESIAAAVESVKKETGGRLDVLVNNSAGILVAPALDASIDEAKKIFDVNVWAPLAMLQAFAPLLIEAKGCIVNNTSVNAYLPFPLMSIYNGSKAALAVASETWRRELQPLGVRTVTLYTSAVKTGSHVRHQKVELPTTSHYFEIQDFMYHLSDGSMQTSAISPRQFATKVVHEVDKGTVGPVWAGTSAFMSRVVGWLPRSVLDIIIEMVVPFSKEMTKAAQRKTD